MIQDLQSKNGTVVGGERLVSPKILADNDVVRFGRSKIIFHAGLPEDDFAEQMLAPTRPATPGDSLAGTLSGFTLLLPGEGDIPDDMPNPQPRPKDPPAYDKEELQTLLSAIASSSWDSVYAEARQPIRGGQGMESDDDTARPRRRPRPSSPTDLSLQASAAASATLVPIDVVPPPPAADIPIAGKKTRLRPSVHLAVACIWVGLLILMNISQKPAASGYASQNPLATPPANTVLDPNLINAADQEFTDPPPAAVQSAPDYEWNSQALKAAARQSAPFLLELCH
jgi:hypothetical protein